MTLSGYFLIALSATVVALPQLNESSYNPSSQHHFAAYYDIDEASFSLRRSVHSQSPGRYYRHPQHTFKNISNNEFLSPAIPTFDFLKKWKKQHLSTSARSSEDNEGNRCMQTADIMLLIDASSGWSDITEEVKKTVRTVIMNLYKKSDNFGIGISEFADKPLPGVGYGNYGGFVRMGVPIDFCYGEVIKKTLVRNDDDVNELIENLAGIVEAGGFDLPEAHLDALILALLDQSFGWTPAEQLVTDDTVARKLVIMFTDQVGHDAEQKTVTNNVQSYNAPLTCEKNKVIGGVGSESSRGFTTAIMGGDESSKYGDLVELATKKYCGGGLSNAEQMEFEGLREYFGPTEVNEVVPHPGDASIPCERTESPSYEQVAQVLRDTNTSLLVSLWPTDGVDIEKIASAWEWVLSVPFADVETGLVKYEEGVDVAESLVAAVEELLAVPCPDTSTSTTSSTSTTTSSTTSTTSSTTSSATTTTPTTSTQSSTDALTDPFYSTTEVSGEYIGGKGAVIGSSIAGAAVLAGVAGAFLWPRRRPHIDTSEEVNIDVEQPERELLEDVQLEHYA